MLLLMVRTQLPMKSDNIDINHFLLCKYMFYSLFHACAFKYCTFVAVHVVERNHMGHALQLQSLHGVIIDQKVQFIRKCLSLGYKSIWFSKAFIGLYQASPGPLSREATYILCNI